MAAPRKTSATAIMESARTLLEAGGAEAVTMHAIARAEGIRAPSLYKHFPDRSAVMEQLALEAFSELAERMREAATTPTPMVSMAHAYRRFARTAPQRYTYMLSADASRYIAVDDARRDAAGPLLAYLRALVGNEHALTFARLLTAFLHGFVTMELTGSFRLGGDPDADFDAGVELLRRTVGDGAR